MAKFNIFVPDQATLASVHSMLSADTSDNEYNIVLTTSKSALQLADQMRESNVVAINPITRVQDGNPYMVADKTLDVSPTIRKQNLHKINGEVFSYTRNKKVTISLMVVNSMFVLNKVTTIQGETIDVGTYPPFEKPSNLGKEVTYKLISLGVLPQMSDAAAGVSGWVAFKNSKNKSLDDRIREVAVA